MSSATDNIVSHMRQVSMMSRTSVGVDHVLYGFDGGLAKYVWHHAGRIQDRLLYKGIDGDSQYCQYAS
jgi:hypothetical protein